MTFTELKAVLADTFDQDPNQIHISAHWLRVEHEAGTLATPPTVLDEGSCSLLLGTLKQRLGFDQLCVCSSEDMSEQVVSDERAAS